MLKLLVLVLTAVSWAKCDEVLLNSLVDLLLEGVEEEMRLGGNGKVATVPDVNKVWERNLGIMTVRAQVLCSGGKITSLGSIKRNGDVTLRKDGGRVSLRANLWLQDLKTSYDKCSVKAIGISTSDPLTMTAGHVSLVTQVSMTRTADNCTNDLDYMAVTDLGTMTSEMGSGIWASIKETILDYFAKRNRERIVNSLNHKLQSAATKALMKRKNLCTKIFFLVRN